VVGDWLSVELGFEASQREVESIPKRVKKYAKVWRCGRAMPHIGNLGE
jgi:hypothetical protein